jgi:hypothetical protein
MMARLMVATVAFSGDYGDPNDPDTDMVLDVDMAYADLRRAGFEVLRLPDHYRRQLYHPLDDFFEVMWVGSDDPEIVDPIWDQIEAIVAPYAGYADQCGPTEPGDVPFADLFRSTPRSGE